MLLFFWNLPITIHFTKWKKGWWIKDCKFLSNNSFEKSASVSIKSTILSFIVGKNSVQLRDSIQGICHHNRVQDALHSLIIQYQSFCIKSLLSWSINHKSSLQSAEGSILYSPSYIQHFSKYSFVYSNHFCIPQLEKCGHEYQTSPVFAKIAILNAVTSENQHNILGLFLIIS